eukprot:TRINITY_DN111094_c0_g1_i1.p1 TRINITY_DN111094_c0_g1~~TRINITY_DN111094_c0_g1_i1.p1  ORF type:complete len:297 (+),score=70.83 TRINITY_DN111094_c0_g1_i1:89-892(+)
MVVVEEITEEDNVKASEKAAGVAPSNNPNDGGKACAYCGDPKAFSWCPLCHEAFYCSAGCQKADWKKHKNVCSKKFAPKETKATIQNPCVRCGKEGKRESHGEWFCSNDCMGANFSDLTARISAAANNKPQAVKHSHDESQKLIEQIRNLEKTAAETARELKAKETLDAETLKVQEMLKAGINKLPNNDAKNTLQEETARVKKLLGASLSAESTKLLNEIRDLLLKSEAGQAGAHEQSKLEKIKAAMEGEDASQSHEEGSPSLDTMN